MTYSEYNARRYQPAQTAERRDSRDAYQLHAERYTREQRETAERLARGLSFA